MPTVVSLSSPRSRNGSHGRGWAAAWHVAISAGVLTAVAVLVLSLWFPGAYREMAGGLGLLALIVGVDLVLGPLLTLVVFDRRKPRRELVVDLAIVGLLQLSALAYGVWSTASARPTHLVLEAGVFRVVTAAQVDVDTLSMAAPELQRMPWSGPVVIAARLPRDAGQQLQSILEGLGGLHLAMQPKYWVHLESELAQIHRYATALGECPLTAGERSARVDRLLSDRPDAEGLRWLPVVARQGDWAAIVGADGRPLLFVRTER